MANNRRPPRGAVKLNKTELDRLLKDEGLKREWLPVEGLPGAYLRPASDYVGGYIRYRDGAGGRGAKQVAHMAGKYPPLTPTQLERKLRETLNAVASGGDPQGDRSKARKTLTVSALCDLYLTEGVGHKKPGTVAMDRSKVAAYLKPALGRMRITEVDKSAVERMRDNIAAGRLRATTPPTKGKSCPPGARAKGGRLAAAKTVKLLQVIFNFAIAGKLCGENPCRGVKVAADVEKERFLSPAELGRLGDVLATFEADPAHAAIIRLLLLTGCRKSEITKLKWREVKNGYLQLEDSKTGAKVVRLGAAAQEVLNKVERGKGPYVFPDRRDPSKPINNIDYAWQKVRKAAGTEDVRIHDLRHSHASVAVAGGSTLLLIAKLLGHKKLTSTQRYAHLAPDAVQAAADKTAEAIEAAMNKAKSA